MHDKGWQEEAENLTLFTILTFSKRQILPQGGEVGRPSQWLHRFFAYLESDQELL